MHGGSPKCWWKVREQRCGDGPRAQRKEIGPIPGPPSSIPSLFLRTTSGEQLSNTCGKGKLVLMSFPKFLARIVRQIAEPDPDFAARVASKILATNLLELWWKVIHAVWIQGFSIPPCDLGGLRIDLDSFPFAVSKVVRDFVGTQSASLAPFLLLVWLMLCITVAWCIP